jgi:rhodanese-related sulfurtransferase
MTGELKRIFFESCVLVAFGVLCGLTLNHQLVMDAFTGSLVSPQSQVEETGARASLPMPVLIDEVRQTQASGGLIVDARSPELYALEHIDGAVSLPMVEVDAELPAFLEQVSKDQVIIIYCSGFGCPDSFDLGMQLIDAGYLDVRVFEGGFPEWRDAGLPVAGDGQ